MHWPISNVYIYIYINIWNANIIGDMKWMASIMTNVTKYAKVMHASSSNYYLPVLGQLHVNRLRLVLWKQFW